MNHSEKTSLYLFNKLSDADKEMVKKFSCDISPEFLGFVETYKKLSEVLPKNFTIVDIGCAYRFQAWYFKDFADYISCDLTAYNPLNTQIKEAMPVAWKEIGTHYPMEAAEFVKSKVFKDLNQETTFAICNYVPCWSNVGSQDPKDVVRKNFKNLFVFYPSV